VCILTRPVSRKSQTFHTPVAQTCVHIIMQREKKKSRVALVFLSFMMTMRISILDSSRIDKSGAMAGKKSPLLSSSFKEEWLGRYRTWLKGGGGGGILSPVSTSRHFFLCCICAWKETFRVAYVRSLLDNVVSFGTTPPSCMPSHYLTYYQKKSDNSFILFYLYFILARI